jgi:hypothetical protein
VTVATILRHLRAVNGKLAGKVKELEATKHQLEQRVKELSESDIRRNEFLAMLAHELRNPSRPFAALCKCCASAATTVERPRSGPMA